MPSTSPLEAKQLRRLNLLFAEEDAALWKQRRDAAYAKMATAKQQLRFDFFIAQQPIDEVRPVQQTTLRGVHEKVADGLPEAVPFPEKATPAGKLLRALTSDVIQVRSHATRPRPDHTGRPRARTRTRRAPSISFANQTTGGRPSAVACRLAASAAAVGRWRAGVVGRTSGRGVSASRTTGVERARSGGWLLREARARDRRRWSRASVLLCCRVLAPRRRAANAKWRTSTRSSSASLEAVRWATRCLVVVSPKMRPLPPSSCRAVARPSRAARRVVARRRAAPSRRP